MPGEVGVWVLILGEILLFSTMFLTYLYYRAKEPELFEASQRSLDQSRAVVLTLLLLTGSWLVVLAVRAVHQGLQRTGRRLLLGAISCGFVFSALKVLEYRAKFHDDLTPETNTFFLLYFALTVFHWVHLLLGMLVLCVLFRLAGKPDLSPRQYQFIEGGACYWHVIDLIWIILFPLLFLVR